jgi:hypothetical protein
MEATFLHQGTGQGEGHLGSASGLAGDRTVEAGAFKLVHTVGVEAECYLGRLELYKTAKGIARKLAKKATPGAADSIEIFDHGIVPFYLILAS